MRQYQSSTVLVLLLLLLGAAPTVWLAASAQHLNNAATARPVFSQERITLKSPNVQPVALTVRVVDTAMQPNALRGGSLPENEGVLWLYPRITDQPLEARAYAVPVSVAFFDRNGVILQVLDIAPCDTRCPSYFPKVAYRGRLEVAKGWFDRHGIGVGSQIEAMSIQILGARQD